MNTERGLTCAVTIPTHNRRVVLEETLARVAALVPPPDEVIVCADGCHDDTVSWLREHHPKVRLLINEEALGCIPARDRMYRATDANIIMVLDDDSYPLQADAVERIRRVFAERPSLAYASWAQRTDEFPESLNATCFGPDMWVGTCVNAASAFRREAFLRIGGFDTLIRKGYDEPDFALRCLAAGYNVQHLPDILIRHHWSSLNRNEQRFHANNAADEQWSLWRHCPWPWVLPVSFFRAIRQAMYALRRGWLIREPGWWVTFAKRWPEALRRRKPVPWRVYGRWMALVRRPIASSTQWRRAQRGMGVRRVDGADAVAASSVRPSIAFAATNPCHMWEMARELDATGHLATYYSGYPAWRLRGVEDMHLRTHAARTVIMYAMRRFLPERWRPRDATLFAWQDEAFDAWAAQQLEPADFVHGLPGQSLETLARAKALGARTVLNHASGPWRTKCRLVAEEYRRAGLEAHDVARPDERQAERLDREMALADFHCAASEVVRRQLMGEGVPGERIWVVPYGADPALFYRRGSVPKGPPRFIFAGACTVRKGVRLILGALTRGGQKDWTMAFYGTPMMESEAAFSAYHGPTPLERAGSVDQAELGRVLRDASALVLPSAEEAFGLVVVQALSCGVPCIVSDRVGAGDLIEHRINGSIVPFGDVQALAEEMTWWAQHSNVVMGNYGWERAAERLVGHSRRAMYAGA